MLTNLKALVVVFALACAAFVIMRPFCLAVMDEATFKRRRNVWFAMTVVGFVSPTFWSYAIVVAIILWRTMKKEENPLALFALVTFVVPNIRFYLPTFLINQLFDLTQYRLLTFVILIPYSIRWLQRRRADDPPAMTSVDAVFLAFLVLQAILPSPYQTGTTTLRQQFLLLVDWFFFVYAFARFREQRLIVEVLCCFCISALILAMAGTFEWLKTWLLYGGLSALWGDSNPFSWAFRGERLRATASTMSPLDLGYQLAMALGFFMYVRTLVRKPLFDWAALALFTVGLYATSSRGPWLTGALAVLVFIALRPGATRRLAGVAVGGALLLGVLYVTPLRESVIDRLPIIGNSDQETIEYRRQLADLSWQLIAQHPFFGDPFVTERMESLRQGQGIIDIVNGYLFTLLFSGWVGMTLQGYVYAVPLLRSSVTYFKARSSSPDSAALGASLIGCFVATLFFIATAGNGITTYMLVGLLASYTFIRSRVPAGMARASVVGTNFAAAGSLRGS